MKVQLAIPYAIAAFGFALPVVAQEYPAKSIRMVVPFPAGGGSDTSGCSGTSRMSRG